MPDHPSPDTTARDFTAILLAAGRGARFDEQESKLRQPFGQEGLVVATRAAQVLLAVVPVVAVVAREDALARQLRDMGCEVVCVDGAAPREMSASLRRGLAHCPQARGWLIALADMPLVQSDTIAALVTALRAGADIVAPVANGRRGHPVGFSARHRPALLALTGDQGARSILAAHPVTEVMVDDAGIAIDIDTRADLEQHRPR